MGKFKDGLNALKKDVEAVEPEIETIYGEFASVLNSLTNAGMRFQGGYETAKMYLVEKFEKNGEKFNDNLKKTLKDVIDKELAMYIKAIEEARTSALGFRKAYDKLRDSLKDILKKNEAIKGQIADLEKSLAKKKKKLIQTKSYKSKVAGYEATLGELSTIVGEWGSMLKNPPQVLTLKFLENTKLSLATTMEDIDGAAGMYVDQEIAAAKDDTADGVKKFRARNPKACLDAVKKWIAEADEMEAESEED